MLLMLCGVLAGCTQKKTPVTKTGVYFDTVISITLYEDNSSELIDECFAMAKEYDRLFSKTNPESDVWKINNSGDSSLSGNTKHNGEAGVTTKQNENINQEINYVEINPETLYLIEKAFEYEDISGGKFSVMCGALTDLWSVNTSGSAAAVAQEDTTPSNDAQGTAGVNSSDVDNIYNRPAPPSDEEIRAAMALCGRDTLTIDHDNRSVAINTIGARLDLGAVAKGYIADKMKEHLISRGVTSGIIQLGGNVLLIGDNPTSDDGLYSIGIARPFSDGNDMITAVRFADKTIVTSGNYQRYFEYDGSIYHHIIDLTTGYPADTGLNSVTVICDSSTEADILSTVLFLSGYDSSMQLLDSLNDSSPGYEAIFVDADNVIIPMN